MPTSRQIADDKAICCFLNRVRRLDGKVKLRIDLEQIYQKLLSTRRTTPPQLADGGILDNPFKYSPGFGGTIETEWTLGGGDYVQNHDDAKLSSNQGSVCEVYQTMDKFAVRTNIAIGRIKSIYNRARRIIRPLSQVQAVYPLHRLKADEKWIRRDLIERMIQTERLMGEMFSHRATLGDQWAENALRDYDWMQSSLLNVVGV